MTAKKSWFDRWVVQNGSYKIVALFVTLVLWVAILGRKDFVLVHELNLNWKLPVKTEIRNRVSETVRIKVRGPRLALERFKKANPELTINLTRAGLGLTNLRIQEDDFTFPAKVNLVSISPSFLSVEIRKVLRAEPSSDNEE